MQNQTDPDERTIPPLPRISIVRRLLDRGRKRLHTVIADARIRVRDARRLRRQRHAHVFEHLIASAKSIAATNPAGLRSLVNAILGPLQAEQILSVAEHHLHGACSAVTFDTMLSRERFFSVFDPRDCDCPAPDGHVLRLGVDVVLTTPWKRGDFENALATIGTSVGRSWRQDPNHRVTLLLPWGFGIVTNGNHSIAAGILASEGTITPSEVLDFAPLLARVGSDGRYFRLRETGKALAAVRDQRMAALFELGHTMVACGQQATSCVSDTIARADPFPAM